jgi:glycosyltransferase involved in cell wall biosynthesis
MSTTSLSVVIPVYNEPRWTPVAVADVCAALARAPFAPVEIIIVDDGSGPETREVLQKLSAPVKLRVIRQDNAGRFAARRTGIEAAAGEMILLIDSRVSIDPDALAFAAAEIRSPGVSRYWNAHVDVDVQGNPYARFWNVLTEVAFREYFANPRTTSFGLDEFDRFPKGTTCFLAPRADLMWAMERFSSYYSDPRDANDDTILIRSLAERSSINISPGFSCLYRARESGPKFVRHAHHRGIVFVDGHLRRGARFMPAIVAVIPLTVVAAVMAIRRPRWAVLAAAISPAAAAGLGVAMRRSRADIAALAALGPVWAVAYGTGIWRGIVKLLGSARR